MTVSMAAVTEAPRPSALDTEAAEFLQERRQRKLRRLPARDHIVALGLAAGFLGAAVTLLLNVHGPAGRSTAYFVLFAAVYALLTAAEFEVGVASAIPTQLVFVPMLFTLPLGWVPICVAVASLSRMGYDMARGRRRASSLPLALMNSWYALAPVIVITVALGTSAPRWSAWPVYALALSAQFGLDFAVNVVWRLTLGLASNLRQQLWIYAVDAALAPVGLLLAFSSHDRPYLVGLVLPLAALLSLFARERVQRIDAALVLGHAYRGTALLLGDVVEADDTYTGEHSRDVVSLTLDVADRLQLSPRDRRTAEFVALLHDVGKIRIPGHIINKPGPLDPDERKIIETHTIEGEAMLSKIGGLLGDVGSIVRSCHERWDGAGYPDGLAGERIPLIARIVCATDAYSAMTTSRPYRKAMSVSDAIVELERCAGTHFDPRVVRALVAVVARDTRDNRLRAVA
jgi:HD-GYP domain-containing protein (c-di-GMP phosphodiesterase class II)